MPTQAEAAERLSSRRVGQKGRHRRSGEQIERALRERGGVVRRHEAAGGAVSDRLEIATRCGGDHDGAEQHRLDQGAPERLVHRRHQEHLAGRQPSLRRVAETHDVDAVGDAAGAPDP